MSTTEKPAQSPADSAGAAQSDASLRGSMGGVPPLERRVNYLQGPRFYVVNVLLGLTFFMVLMELTVVATALVDISTDIGGYENSSWVMTSYLLGYISLIIIFSKLGDIFGRKTVLVFCLALFTIFSGACGAAQTLNQLIILRAFQGVGGGGCFAMNMVCMTEIVPPERYGPYSAVMGIPPVLSMALGPIIGGAIVSSTTWRWVFLMNLPAGGVALLLAIFSIPGSFPYNDGGETHSRGVMVRFKDVSQRADFVGSALLFLGSLAFSAVFSEADSRFPWNSAYVISLLTVSGLLWIGLLLWERYISSKDTIREPVLPWRLLTNRVISGMLLSSILLGGPTTASMFVIPARFQVLNGVSGLDAGIRLLPFALGISVGAITGSILSGRIKLPPVFVAFAGGLLEVAGFAILSTLPATVEIASRTYGAQAIAGLGCGITYQCFYVTMPIVAHPRDAAIGVGAVTQFRMMGGAIFLAIATSVFNGSVLPTLKDMGMHSIEELTNPEARAGSPGLDSLDELREVLNTGYNRQMLVLCASAAAQTLVVLLMWKKPQIRLP